MAVRWLIPSSLTILSTMVLLSLLLNYGSNVNTRLPWSALKKVTKVINYCKVQGIDPANKPAVVPRSDAPRRQRMVTFSQP
jgi:hypothetical protein